MADGSEQRLTGTENSLNPLSRSNQIQFHFECLLTRSPICRTHLTFMPVNENGGLQFATITQRTILTLTSGRESRRTSAPARPSLLLLLRPNVPFDTSWP
jgi:hypothetical protein